MFIFKIKKIISVSFSHACAVFVFIVQVNLFVSQVTYRPQKEANKNIALFAKITHDSPTQHWVQNKFYC